MPDKEILAEKAVIKWAEAHGWLAVKVKFQGRNGIHDRLFISPEGIHVYIEFKRRGKQARPNQWWWQREFDRRGVAAYTEVTEREHGIAILQQFC